MFSVTIPSMELWDEKNQKFIYIKDTVIDIEHSLISISKWESRWNKPFLGLEEKTKKESIDYIRCMTLTENVDPNIYEYLPDSVISEISEYIEQPMTATEFYEFGDSNDVGVKKVITSEEIYYWMIMYGIPFECQYWHINRLLTLIKVCNIKNSTPKKMSPTEIMNRNHKINQERKKRMNTKG